MRSVSAGLTCGSWGPAKTFFRPRSRGPGITHKGALILLWYQASRTLRDLDDFGGSGGRGSVVSFGPTAGPPISSLGLL